MKIYGMYFGKRELYQIIRGVGGEWNDSKERPLVCLLKIDNSDVYWAIPVGNLDHRTDAAKKRIYSYINRNTNDIGSCYYHIGKTTKHTIFFISDVIPITDRYIEREYKGRNSEIYIIKNKNLLTELERKLKRILYYENKNPNYFRQHITDIKNYLITELNSETKNKDNEA